MARAKTARPNGKGKTVKDLKNGRAADDHQVAVDGDNGGDDFEPEGETVDEFLEEAARVETEKEQVQERMRLRNEPDRKKIADLNKKVAGMKATLVRDGYNGEALDAKKRQFLLRRKADLVTKELDKGQMEAFRKLDEAWKDFRHMPLGAAAEAREHADT